jgi:hypothetical protein
MGKYRDAQLAHPVWQHAMTNGAEEKERVEHWFICLETVIHADNKSRLLCQVGSIAFIKGATVESSISNSTAVYFSFVTLASRGHGDIVPLSDPARGLAVIEVIGGQLYLAVLVARLVGVVRRGISTN